MIAFVLPAPTYRFQLSLAQMYCSASDDSSGSLVIADTFEELNLL